MTEYTGEKRQRKNYTTNESYQPQNIKDLIYRINKINLQPRYQRDISWTTSKMNDLISTIMNNGIMPGIMLYLYPIDDINYKEDKCEYEAMDGQHRLFTIDNFKKSQYVNVKGRKPNIIYWSFTDNNGKENPVFYQETEDTKKWEKENKTKVYYMDDEERHHFDNFAVDIKLIRKKLTEEERGYIFVSLQNGVPVRNSDINKNLGTSLMEFFRNNDYEVKMKEKVFKKCTRNPDKYSTHWFTRFIRLYKPYDKDLADIFVYGDLDYNKAIINNIIILNDDEKEDFNNLFEKFVNIISSREIDDVKYDPTQLFALFVYIKNNYLNNEKLLDCKNKIISNSRFWVNNTPNEEKRYWEKNSNKIRKEYFNKCLEILNEWIIHPEVDRKPIDNKLRKLVWAKIFEKEKEGLCQCCEKTKIENKKDGFQCGHIQAWHKGGLTVLNNLLPICKGCNLSMGTKNLREYKNGLIF